LSFFTLGKAAELPDRKSTCDVRWSSEVNGDGEPGGVGQKEKASFPAKKRLKSGSKLPVMITD
jgi:hypothetical protein